MRNPRGQAGKLILFVVVTLTTTALLHGAILAAGLRFSLAPSSPALYLYLCGLAAPTLVAIALTAPGSRSAFLRRSLAPSAPRVSYAYALFAQAALVASAWLLLIASGSDQRPEPSLPTDFIFLAIGQVWVVLGEELGWRAFALPKLTSLFSPRTGTLLLAVVWGIWHVPMFFVPGSLQATMSPWLFAASILAWTSIHTALYQKSSPSVLPNMVFHASANLTLNLGLVTAALEPYLMVAYVVAAALSFAALRTRAAP